jgi:hypothetical protein
MMKYTFLSLALASLASLSWATDIAFVNNTGHRVTIEPVYSRAIPGTAPLEPGKTFLGGSTVLAVGQMHTYKEVEFKTLDSYRIYYTTGIKSYLSTITLSGRELAQRALQANAPRITVTLEASGLTGTGITYTLNVTPGPQTGATQPVKFEESFIGVGIENPIETALIYDTLNKKPGIQAYELLDLTQPPARRALPNQPLSHQPQDIREYALGLKKRYDELEKYYNDNKAALDSYYQENYGITDYANKALDLHKKAYQQLISQLGL